MPVNFHDYAWVVCNSSGGKDSQTALRKVVLDADEQGYPRDQIVVSHQKLGGSEWPETLELVYEQSGHYGLATITRRYRNRDGQHLELLDVVRKRGMWPSNKQRYCTSEFKRGPGNTLLTFLSKQRPGNILQVFGFRHEESPARAKKVELANNKRASTKTRRVDDYCPILTMTTEEVWADIRASGVRHHYVYDHGLSRHSCILCIFAPESQLMAAGRLMPRVLDDHIEVEQEIGHTFQNGRSLESVRAKIRAGEEPEKDDGVWNM